MKFLYENFLQFYLLALTSITQHFKKIKVLNLFINKQIEKDDFSKKHLKKILLKVLRFRSYFNSKIKLLWKEIFDRDIKFYKNNSRS
ncbi:hypothetical protein [Spiroplasma endosymbiont of Andrena trimmerana]|uniref:hypothetical protein n=1 Tax=Spiroplasma endosymbiont of Andrena trimmerana TaxID=3066316 RepID=UPI0030D47036